MDNEKPIARCQAIKTRCWQDGKGQYISFLIKDNLPPEEFNEELLRLPVGEVINLYVTKEEL